MTTAATTPGESRSRTASAIILGTDAVLAAHPATAVQLAHACLRAGYSTVIPASWGDELLATETIRQLQEKAERPFVYCACPHVSTRLLGVGDDLAPFLLPLVAPPVAVALHLRELAHGEPLDIAFVGACPAGDDVSIDAHFTPGDFLTMLEHRGIVLLEQPEVFDSVLPPDRRRHRSLPGGVPTAEALWSDGGRRALIEIADSEPLTELAQHLASGEAALLDLGPALSCTCSGAVPGVSPRNARSAVCALEPPRSRSEIIEPSPFVQLSRPLHTTIARQTAATPTSAAVPATAAAPRVPPSADVPSREGAARVDDTSELPAGTPPSAVPTEAAQTSDTSARATDSSSEPLSRRRSATATVRAAPGSVPVTNSGEGRVLPRAYVAHRSGRRRVSAEERGSGAHVMDAQPGPAPQPRNGSSNARVFASVPIAAAPPSARGSSARPTPSASESQVAPEAIPVAISPAPATVSTPSARPGPTPDPGPDSTRDEKRAPATVRVRPAPMAMLHEHARRFAHRSAERPMYLGILIAVVAVLSIALGIAAGRTLRGATPMTAEPTDRGAPADSLFGTSSTVPGAESDTPTPSGRRGGPAGGAGPTDDTRNTTGSRPRSGRPVAPGALQQSAAGSVAPLDAPRTGPPVARQTRTPAADRTDERVAPVRDSVATDSTRRAVVVADSGRRDSVASDSARRAAAARDSVERAVGDSLPGTPPGGAVSSVDSLLQRERVELRQALAERQRRIDSLQRWLDSARRTPPPSAPPPR